MANIPVLSRFLDAVYESIRRTGSQDEAMLAAWAVTREGRNVVLSWSVGNAERDEAGQDCLRDRVRRGLQPPLTVTTDGAPGLLRAVERQGPNAVRIRGGAHKARNVLSRVPEASQAQVREWLYTIRDAADYAAGQQAYAHGLARLEQAFPSAARSLAEDHEALLAHLRRPPRHRVVVRTTHRIERCFAEERRRTQVLPRFGDEKSALKLIFSAVIRATAQWRVVGINAEEAWCLEDLWAQHPPQSAPLDDPETLTA